MPSWLDDDPSLRQHLERLLDPAAFKEGLPLLQSLGSVAPGRLSALAALADRHRPILHRYAPGGERIDHVEYHPAYEEIRAIAREHRLARFPYEPFAGAERGPRVLSLALGYLFGQAEAGFFCPACMTDGAARVLDRRAPAPLRDRLVPGLASLAIEGAMFLTEKAGGSDVGATETVAVQGEGGGWRLTGEKWFCSNVTAEVILTLARPVGAPAGTAGLGLFVLEPTRRDGSRNFRIERLKDKLGVTSMPTGEVVLDGSEATLLAAPPQGMKAMLDMVNLSRLYNAVASAGILRRAARFGVEHGRERSAFGKPLREHPLYRVGVARVALEAEAAAAYVLETAAALDAADRGDADAALRVRLLTPVGKAAIGKACVAAASEAIEFLGGNGYVEDFPAARLLRDAQVLPVWEGTTNVQSLDVLRVLADPRIGEAILADARRRAATAPAPLASDARRLERALGTLETRVAELPRTPRELAEAGAWRLTRDLYDALAAAYLLGHAVWLLREKGDWRACLVSRTWAKWRLGNDESIVEEAALARYEEIAEGRAPDGVPEA